MRIGHFFKAIIGIVGSFIAVGCSHSKSDVEDPPNAIYGPPEAFNLKPEPLPEVDEPPSDIYGPPEAFNLKPEPLPEVDEPPSDIYGPPEAFNLEPEPLPEVEEASEPLPEVEEASELLPEVEEASEPFPIPSGVATYGPPAAFNNLIPKGSVINPPEKPVEPEPTEPIVEDIKGNYKTIEATLLSVTMNKNYRTIKLAVDNMDGINVGSVGEIYINDQPVKNGRFKITEVNVNKKYCMAITNATTNQIKEANRSVIKIPTK